MAGLKPCPFCGDSFQRVINDNQTSFVVCRECEATGPIVVGADGGAIAAWNRRAAAANGQVSDALAASIDPFVTDFEDTHEHSYRNADEAFTAALDRNTVTPRVTVGDFRKLAEAFRATLPDAASAAMGQVQEPVVLPERVIDVLWQQAGLDTYHPDGDQQLKFYVFASLVVQETLARLPATSADEPKPRYQD